MKKSFRNKKRNKRIHKYVKIGSNKTRCGRWIEGERMGTGGSLKWVGVTCPTCLKKKDATKRKLVKERVKNVYENLLVDLHNDEPNEKAHEEIRAVVLVGNPIDGFEVIGSFNNKPEAIEWAYNERFGDSFFVTDMYSVGQWEHR